MACCGNGIPERASNIPVDGPILVEEARIIAERFGEDTFKGTSGWLEKWKKETQHRSNEHRWGRGRC